MDLLAQFDQNFSGFAQANSETLEALTKAMTAGSGLDAAAFTGGRALTPESLDTVLVDILHTTDEARLFMRLKKKPVQSVIHQWDERTEVGADDGAWVSEGGDSEDTDQTIARKWTQAKYLQTRRKVTLQASVTSMIEDAIALEKQAGTLWLIRNIEHGLIYGNSSYVSVEQDGLIAQIPATNILDMRGGDPTGAAFEDKMNEAARTIRDNYGIPTTMFSSTMVMQDVQALLRDRIRFGTGNVLGSAVFKEYPTPFGNFDLVDDIFIKEGAVPAVGSLTAKHPALPTFTTARANHADSEFVAGDAGNYYYKVVALNQYGEGAVSAESSVVAVQSGDRVTLAVTQGTGPTPSAYKIYRTKKGTASGSAVRYMFTVAFSASPMNVYDVNGFLPGCSDVFVLNMNTAYNAIEWVQFLPMMKFDLYPTNAAIFPWLQLIFGSLAIKKTVQHIRIKNVSPSTLGWF